MADRRSTVAALVLFITLPETAFARVLEYQIVRLLSYKTQCDLATLENKSAATGPMRFLAHCNNLTFYPDGVDIVCPDRDDDRSCRVLTQEKTFDHLHLLDQKR